MTRRVGRHRHVPRGLETGGECRVVRAGGTLHGHERRTVRGHHGVARGWHHVRRRGIVHARLAGWRRLLERRAGPVGCGGMLELEVWVIQICGLGDGDLDPLPDEDVIKLFELKTGVVTFEKGLALGNLLLNAFSVSTGCEGLAMSVLLMADGTGCSARCASRVLGVALEWGRVRVRMEIAAGVARRDLPLFFCSCILHMPHGTASIDGVQMKSVPHRLQFPAFFSFYWMWKMRGVGSGQRVLMAGRGDGWAGLGRCRAETAWCFSGAG